MSTKDSNPKDIIGCTKIPWSTIPIQVLGEIGLAMLEGALKYGRHNYRSVGVRASVYFDACVARHLAAWWEGEDIDEDSGLSHVTKAIACLVVLRDSMIQGNWTDDRPPRVKNRGWIKDLNLKVKALLAKHPEPKEPFTELNTNIDLRPPATPLPTADRPRIAPVEELEALIAALKAGSYSSPYQPSATPVPPGPFRKK